MDPTRQEVPWKASSLLLPFRPTRRAQWREPRVPVYEKYSLKKFIVLRPLIFFLTLPCSFPYLTFHDHRHISSAEKKNQLVSVGVDKTFPSNDNGPKCSNRVSETPKLLSCTHGGSPKCHWQSLRRLWWRVPDTPACAQKALALCSSVPRVPWSLTQPFLPIIIDRVRVFAPRLVRVMWVRGFWISTVLSWRRVWSFQESEPQLRFDDSSSIPSATLRKLSVSHLEMSRVFNYWQGILAGSRSNLDRAQIWQKSLLFSNGHAS